jgi:TPR repeat protein
MGSSPQNSSGDISAVRLRLLTPDEWARILAADSDEAARWVGAAAQHGFRAAQVTWGQMLLDGRGVARNPAAAFHWFRRAADAGSIDGINMVGRCYELGWGVASDHGEAIRWYRRAAARSSPWGQYNLASMLLYGEGVEHDRARALHHYHVAARQGHAKAMGMVGRFHEEGWTVPADAAQALHWYRQAAEGGDFWGLYHLARMTADTHPGEALVWLAQAIEGGTPNFLRSVGPTLLDHAHAGFRQVGLRALERCCESDAADDCYAYGRALAAHGQSEKAALWLRRAARKGHNEARSALLKLTGTQERPRHPLRARFTEWMRRLRPANSRLFGLQRDTGP